MLTTNLVAAGRATEAPPEIVPAVIMASRSDDAPLRGAAAFTLGVVGGDEAVERLVQLAADDNDDVRFNAALGLAQTGP